MRSSRLRHEVVIVAIALVLGACAHGGERAQAGAGLQASLTDEELTARAPVVISGQVESSRVAPYASHPDLRATDDPYVEDLIRGAATRPEWHVDVVEVIKGALTSPIWIVGGISAEGVLVEDSDRDTGDELETGGVYTFWLEPDALFGSPYFILLRAKTA